MAVATAKKRQDYLVAAEARGYRFKAIPVEVQGAFSPQLRQLIRELSLRSGASLPDGASPAAAQDSFVRYWPGSRKRRPAVSSTCPTTRPFNLRRCFQETGRGL